MTQPKRYSIEQTRRRLEILRDAKSVLIGHRLDFDSPNTEYRVQQLAYWLVAVDVREAIADIEQALSKPKRDGLVELSSRTVALSTVFRRIGSSRLRALANELMAR